MKARHGDGPTDERFDGLVGKALATPPISNEDIVPQCAALLP